MHANSYEHYIDPIPGYSRPDTEHSGGTAPAHLYTLHLVRSVFNEEIFQLYLKYEKAIHNKDRNRGDFEAFYSNSPIVDAKNEPAKAQAPMLGDS